ncbi:MAG: DUF4278 domain-containing protein [Xenococcaceae cyanobacterium MO_167.B52]|nr:DUF4278 domain-containing protein [Xenococcaceae cyanobacterium MO_167.B52]
MKLIYRATAYEYNPPVVNTVEGNVGGKFRGLDWRFHNLKQRPVLQPPVNLTYRGVTYANRPTATAEGTEQNIQEKARWLMLNQEKVAKNRNDSMLLRSAHEVGLV